MGEKGWKQYLKETAIGNKAVEIRDARRLKKRQELCRTDIRQAVIETYNSMFDKPLDLEHPQTINEKMQYLKLNTYYNNPLITKCVDKYLVKEYLKEIGMPELAVPLFGVYDNPEDIKWDELPEQFVIKCNHGSGYNMIVEDKRKLDIPQVEKTLKKWMEEEYWTYYAEPQYQFVDRKILIEEFLGGNIRTYKFYCFNGEPKVAYVSSDHDKYYDYFDVEWNRLDVYLTGHGHYPGEIARPKKLEEMLSLSRKLSAEFPLVRVDLYDIDGKLYLSEYTFIPTGGYMHLVPQEKELEWGSWLKLEDAPCCQ